MLEGVGEVFCIGIREGLWYCCRGLGIRSRRERKEGVGGSSIRFWEVGLVFGAIGW